MTHGMGFGARVKLKGVESFFYILGGVCLIAVTLGSHVVHLLRDWAGLMKLYIRAAWWSLPAAAPFLYDDLANPGFWMVLPVVQWPPLWNLLALLRAYCGAVALIVGVVLLVRAIRRSEPWLKVALASGAMALPFLALGLR